jgi:hypothetical protein
LSVNLRGRQAFDQQELLDLSGRRARQGLDLKAVTSAA